MSPDFFILLKISKCEIIDTKNITLPIPNKDKLQNNINLRYDWLKNFSQLI
jgi:hypothetical protein